MLGFVISFQRTSVQSSNSTRTQETLQTKLDEMSALIEMRRNWHFWVHGFSLNSSELTHSEPVPTIDNYQKTICNREYENTNEIEPDLNWLTEPVHLTEENYTTVMENTLQKMVMAERDKKLCWNFYGKLLTDIQHWLNEVNVSSSLTRDETYDFELMSQVGIC